MAWYPKKYVCVVYRDSLASYEPGPEDSMGATVDTSYLDCNPVDVQAYYLVRVVDAVGRKSEDSKQVDQFQRALAIQEDDLSSLSKVTAQ